MNEKGKKEYRREKKRDSTMKFSTFLKEAFPKTGKEKVRNHRKRHD